MHEPAPARPASGAPRRPDRDPFAAILRGIADARVDDAATARSRAHWLRRQAEEAATLADALLELAEQRTWVHLRVRGGAVVSGVAAGVGADVMVLHTDVGPMLVRIDRLAQVRATGSPVPSAAGPRPDGTGRAFVDLLRDLAAERAPVVVHTDDGQDLRGALRAVGADVLTLRMGSSPLATVLVSLDAVTMVGVAPAA